MAQQRALDVRQVQSYLRAFARSREREKYHSPKNLAMALAVEAGGLLEIFQWVTEQESWGAKDNPRLRQAVGEELADILQYVLRMADILGIDIDQALWAKLEENEQTHPAGVTPGNARN